MIEEHQNFGLAGATLKVVRSPVTALAFELTIESNRRWHEAEAQLYLELGLDAAEYHANWGIPMNGTGLSTGCPLHGGPGDVAGTKALMIGKSYHGTSATGVAATGADGLTTIVATRITGGV